MSTKKPATKTSVKASKTTKAKASPAKPIKTVEETANGVVEVKSPAKPEGKKPKATKATKTKDDAKKLSAIDAAAQVLAASKEPLNAKQMIEAMATEGLWTSPGGQTPHATLYSAILREITTKGKESRFVKTERGRFTVNA